MGVFRQTKGAKRRAAPLYSVLFLLALYIGGVIEIESFHTVYHGSLNEEELHSQLNESDACHQRVYHNVNTEDCKHKSHVVAVKKCPLCQLTIQSLHLASVRNIAEKIILIAQPGFESLVADLSVTPNPDGSRAPPIA